MKTRAASARPATRDVHESNRREPSGLPIVGEPRGKTGGRGDGDDQSDEQLGHPRRLRNWSVDVLPMTSSIRRA